MLFASYPREEGGNPLIVSLIGYRGTGKTTVGLILADRLGWKCIDTDDLIQQRAGSSIREIFERQGEAAFRDLEAAVISDVVRAHRVVLALGGGAILRPENRQLLRVAGPVVWLTAEPATIRHRLLTDPASRDQRPALLVSSKSPASAADEIERVLMERLPLYEASADLKVATDSRTPSEIADEVAAALDLQPERGLS